MTADERIEDLLNSFGQTINDLPKAPYMYPKRYAYSHEQMDRAYEDAWRWHRTSIKGMRYCEDYICHLIDMIGRMEDALETARRLVGCITCEIEPNFLKQALLRYDLRIDGATLKEDKNDSR